MSVWGSAGKTAWNSYKNAMNIGLLRKTMGSAYKKQGAYGAYTAFNRWSRGFNSPGKSTIGMVAARRGTMLAAGTLIGGSIFGAGIGMNPKGRR
jgi:hypothetical protein